MSDTEQIEVNTAVDQGTKKRKRSGKEREKRKAEAIAAAAAAAASEQKKVIGDVAAVIAVSEPAVAEEISPQVDLKKLEVATLEGAHKAEDDGLAVEEERLENTEDVDEEMIETVEPSDTVDIEKVKNRVPQGLKSMLPVLKRAKTSETQRLIKKIKFLRKKAGESEEAATKSKQELADLEQQLDIIKRLDLASLVQPLLSLKIRKHPRLKPFLPLSSDFFPAQPKPTPASSTLQIKVENRLYSSKPTSDAITAVINWVVGQEGASLKYAHNKGVNAASKAKNAVVKTSRASGVDEDVDMDAADETTNASIGDEAEGDDLVGQEDLDEEEQAAVRKVMEDMAAEAAAAEEAGWESGDLGEEDEGDSGSEDEDEDADSDDSGAIDWDQVELDSESEEPEAVPPKSEPTKQKGSTSSASTPRPTVKPGTPVKSELPSKKKQKMEPVEKYVRPSTAAITSSMFLPSLKSGFTMGDYDSDPEEDERRDNKAKGLNANGERKNRRGQMERQMIAEKKYGSRAKHLVKAAKLAAGTSKLDQSQMFMQNQGGGKQAGGGKWSKPVVPAVDGGWGKRPTTPRYFDQPGETLKPSPSTSAAISAPISKVEVGLKKPAAEPKAEHPSWEAARLRKQRESQLAAAALAGGGPAKPKKIVFD